MKKDWILVLFMGVLAQVKGNRITLDENAREICKKYKTMCKPGEVCAVQHFEDNLTMPICIPLSFVPVRNMYCQLSPDTGTCHARYIRWYFNVNSQECTYFQYGGCDGNQNNFKSKEDCERTCMATPAIKLYENGNSALIQPAIMTAPIYEPQKTENYEALNSIMDGEPYDRYQLTRHRVPRPSRDESNNSRTRRRLDKEKEKEKERKRKDRERRREIKRLRRLRKKEQRKQKKREQRLKEKMERKKKQSDMGVIEELFNDEEDDENEVVKKGGRGKEKTDIVRQTKDMSSGKDESERELRKKERRRERKRLKRRERRKRRMEKERRRMERLNKDNGVVNEDTESDNADLVKKPDSSISSKMFAILDQGKKVKSKKDSDVRTT